MQLVTNLKVGIIRTILWGAEIKHFNLEIRLQPPFRIYIVGLRGPIY